MSQLFLLQLLPEYNHLTNIFFYLHLSYWTHSFTILPLSSYPHFLTLGFSSEVWVDLKVWQHSCTVSPSDLAWYFQYSCRLPWNLNVQGTTFLSSHVQIQQLIYRGKRKLSVQITFLSTTCGPINTYKFNPTVTGIMLPLAVTFTN